MLLLSILAKIIVVNLKSPLFLLKGLILEILILKAEAGCMIPLFTENGINLLNVMIMISYMLIGENLVNIFRHSNSTNAS